MDFKPDQKARRIDPRETFTMRLTFTADQIRELAKEDCVVCFGRGFLVGKPCSCIGIKFDEVES
jgi:hypothetical protein